VWKNELGMVDCVVLRDCSTYSNYISANDEKEQRKMMSSLWMVPFVSPKNHTSTNINGELLDKAAFGLLYKAWKISKNPSQEAIDELAVHILASKSTIKSWFHNRRKTRKVRGV